MLALQIPSESLFLVWTLQCPRRWSAENRVICQITYQCSMHRSLKGRHVSMIAIAGTIGTGLFLVSDDPSTAHGFSGSLLLAALCPG